MINLGASPDKVKKIAFDPEGRKLAAPTYLLFKSKKVLLILLSTQGIRRQL